jgi:hypothetical protein
MLSRDVEHQARELSVGIANAQTRSSLGHRLELNFVIE